MLSDASPMFTNLQIMPLPWRKHFQWASILKDILWDYFFHIDNSYFTPLWPFISRSNTLLIVYHIQYTIWHAWKLLLVVARFFFSNLNFWHGWETRNKAWYCLNFRIVLDAYLSRHYLQIVVLHISMQIARPYSNSRSQSSIKIIINFINKRIPIIKYSNGLKNIIFPRR